MGNLFTSPGRLPLIAPSILSADFARMGEECRGVLRAGADALHLDVMDGHFAPNLTMGPALCASLRRALPNAFLDVHLMVTDPGTFVEPFARAGASHLTFHVEAVEPRAAEDLSGRIRSKGMSVGVAINPPTPSERIGPYLGMADLVLVMSVSPGFSGQAFMPEVLVKTEQVRSLLGATQRLEMDGGIGLTNCERVRGAGCDVIVAASAVFGVEAAARSEVIQALRGL